MIGCILENVVLKNEVLAVTPWQAILDVLQTSDMAENSLNLLKNLRFVEIQNSLLILEADNNFAKDWILKHFLNQILNAANSLETEISAVDIRVNPRRSIKPIQTEIQLSKEEIQREDKFVRLPKPVSRGLYSKNTFENFIAGNCNREAFEICKKIASEPCQTGMPLVYVYGHSGLGKTHLLQAIVHSVNGSNRNVRVRYVSAIRFLQDFLNQFKGTFKEKQKAEINFREAYEGIDLLLIDDVQLLSQKDATQLSLLQIIERRRLHGRQTVFSSDRLPSEMDQRHFKKRLLDRLEECLVVKLDLPDAQTRMGFVKRETVSFPFPEKERADICRWIATPSVPNFRVLFGKLNRLQAEHDFMQRPLSLHSVRMLLCPDATGRTIEAIAEATALAFGVCGEALRSPDRIQKVSFVRKVAMYICREDTEEPLQVIGAFFGRNHSTVISSCNSVAEMLQNNEDLAWRIQEIRYSFGRENN